MHRLRRALERELALEITTPDGYYTQPLRLSWQTFEKTLSDPRREVFERGNHDWSRIRVRVVLAPSESHG
jgi:hypothetical protein